MVARVAGALTPSDLEQRDHDELNRRAFLAATVGPYRRIYGKQSSFVFPGAGTQRVAQNASKDRILFVTLSNANALAVVVFANHSSGSNIQTISASLSQAGAGGVPANVIDFILYPGDELDVTSTAPVSALVVNEQRF